MSKAGEDSLLQIAQVLKSNGTDGDLILGFRDISPEEIDIEEPVFIYYDGLPVPFFIESLTPRGNSKAVVKFYDIDSYEDAEEIVGKGVFAEDSFQDEEKLGDIIGWTLFDEEGVRVGEIAGIEEIPGNPCIYVNTSDREIIIPLHEDLILEIRSEQGEIFMKIPAGLL